MITAEVVAIDQIYVYDRFGAFNPGGMVFALRRDVVAADPSQPIGPGNAMLRPGKRPRPLVLRVNVGDKLVISFTNWLTPLTGVLPNRSPTTRHASIHVAGLQVWDAASLGGNAGQNPSSLAAPGETRIYELHAEHEGAFLMQSAGAMASGDAPGPPQRSAIQALFGVVNVEPAGAVAYRSQVTGEELASATRSTRNPDGTPRIDYDAIGDDGEPILKMVNDEGEIVHGDLNAIIAGYDDTEMHSPSSVDQGVFREFTVLFHDDLGVQQSFNELRTDLSLISVRPGFGINYGAASLGAAVIANRTKVGPSKQCVECKFEEFFLSSWANGDPAMVIERDAMGNPLEALYPDDPSNVHHGYLGDPVRFRNVHAGPHHTHVFHLHGHQWRRSADNGAYVDSQTLGPGGAFTYDINYGGGGNRNMTAGDAIFHCHLYPHFVQGMWAIWRSHDVFEAGTADRKLPDGEIPGGAPSPAVVPMPDRAMPPMPTYAPTMALSSSGQSAQRPAMPGYPFYVAALAGHRPPQPPRDMAHDGGLPRHLVTSVPASGVTYGDRGRFDVQIHEANLKLLPANGTPSETAASAFHAGQFPGAVPATTMYGFPAKGYKSFTPEGMPTLFLVNGQAPAPGAPFADPCPPNAPVRTFRAAYVQVDATINSSGWHDPQLRTMVLEGDYRATLAGTRPPEPLYVRAQSGECVVFHATNTIPDVLEADDFQIFTPTDIIGQHIHLLKYDITASDGAANGFNYEDGTLAAEEVLSRIAAANAAGGAFAADGAVAASGGRVHLAASSHPTLQGAPLGAQTTTQRWWADPLLDTQGQDRALSTAFTHDHFGAASQQHHGLYAGLVVEPAGTTWRDPATGETFGNRSDGGPTSYRADIVFPPGDWRKSFREFNLNLADYSIVYDECGDPVHPPTFYKAALPQAIAHQDIVAPEAISLRDPGTQTINYRNEPIPMRIAKRDCATGVVTQKASLPGDMHNVFSSIVHGDPATPLLEAYEGDRILMRIAQGAQGEQHVFSVNGRRWLRETQDSDSGFTNGQPIGISEQMDVALDPAPLFTKNLVGGADYLYQSAATDDLWDGMWGILRVHSLPQPKLKVLPGSLPPILQPPQQGQICPTWSPVRRYEVSAIAAQGNLPGDRLTYNAEYGLYDPDAILFALKEDLPGLRSGSLAPEPLILRAAAGECVEVTLTNELPNTPPRHNHWTYGPGIVEGFNTNQVRSSNHVSLHPQLVSYDVVDSDGANVGMNGTQTVAPGQKRKYTWFAGRVTVTPQGQVVREPVELGAVNLRDMADVVNHGMHGAVGVLIVEPQGSTWTTRPSSRAQAVVQNPGGEEGDRAFNELVLVYQDEVALHSDRSEFQCADSSLFCGTALPNIGGEIDSDVTGHKGFNYRAEPVWARLGVGSEQRLGAIPNLDQRAVLSSAVHGDPATPLFTVKRSDKVRLRILQPSGHRHQHAFAMWGMEWPHNPWAEGSGSRQMGHNDSAFTIGVQSGIGPMTAWNLNPAHRAGGKFQVVGDRLYLDQSSVDLAGGLWGLMRVTP
ncbi:multicopper oxidase [Chondromyces apiculatus]|nr:multicopper oxidase [Chondromyces apiculatus]